MATGRTISASFLTDMDTKVIELCNSISEVIYNRIPNDDFKKEFKKEYGKISYTRDSGLGLGGGKLQRDAVCTRGRQGKAPFSNRNLRWHPLVVAENKPEFAKKIERIESGTTTVRIKDKTSFCLMLRFIILLPDILFQLNINFKKKCLQEFSTICQRSSL